MTLSGYDNLELEACRGFARMMNTLDVSHLTPWLADDMTYSSQRVFASLSGKEAYLNYITEKLETVRKANASVWAEIAHTEAFSAGPCVVLAQGTKDNLVSTLLLKLRDGKIVNMDMCAVPAPNECYRTGEFPA